MRTVAVNEFCEIISNTVTWGFEDQITVQHIDLPEVNDELSVALRLKLKSHSSSWAYIFHKGRTSRVYFSEIIG